MKRSAFLAVPALAAAAAIALPIATAGSSTSVKVTGKEYKFKLQPPTVSHGKVTFKFTNKGKLAHDFKIDGKKTKILQPGKSATITLTLKKGTYKYLCTVPGHADKGMKGKLRVS
jgi:uncharacterized cupredoxin-like copper-binding protein